ncbi:MAG: hypothetical protein H6Q90_6688, partial [Deltaproteobacteria bacterium]|nr:hypothetical protein [Deltaproteobacteria bacterium]
YLPASGTPASLTSSYTDPPTTTSGQFGGEVVALKLNIDFDDAGITSGSSPIALGDVYLCGLTSPAVVNGSTVRGFLSTASSVLGGDTVAGLSANDATLLAAELSVAFLGGLPSQFADDHLSPTPCAP